MHLSCCLTIGLLLCRLHLQSDVPIARGTGCICVNLHVVQRECMQFCQGNTLVFNAPCVQVMKTVRRGLHVLCKYFHNCIFTVASCEVVDVHINGCLVHCGSAPELLHASAADGKAASHVAGSVRQYAQHTGCIATGCTYKTFLQSQDPICRTKPDQNL